MNVLIVFGLAAYLLVAVLGLVLSGSAKRLSLGMAGLAVPVAHLHVLTVFQSPLSDRLTVEVYRWFCSGGKAFLAFGYQLGLGGLPKDLARAAQLFRKVCDGGTQPAAPNLGALYERGEGVPADLSRARALYQQGCRDGDDFGCKSLEAVDKETGDH